MEGEVKRFVMTWMTAVLSLSYCHALGKIISKGPTRFVAILPVVLLFLYLPLNLSTLWFVWPTSFFLSWLANFKLVLFAFGRGPLASSSTHRQPLSVPLFVCLASLPIRINPIDKERKRYKRPPPKPYLVYAIKAQILATYTLFYDNRERIPTRILFSYYCMHFYVALELFVAILSILPRVLFGVELEPAFRRPYLSTSLQDFWGRRWNLITTGVLRPAVYDPVKSFSARLIGEGRATFLAVLAVYVVSAIMHEVVFYHIGRKKPTGKLTWFFVVHVICLMAEIAAKKWANGKFKLPVGVSRAVTLYLVGITGGCLLAPELVHCDFDVRHRQEISAVDDFVKGIYGGTYKFFDFGFVAEAVID